MGDAFEGGEAHFKFFFSLVSLADLQRLLDSKSFCLRTKQLYVAVETSYGWVYLPFVASTIALNWESFFSLLFLYR